MDTEKENKPHIGMGILPSGIVSNKTFVEIRTGISRVNKKTEFIIEFFVDSEIVKQVSRILYKDNYISEKYWWNTHGKTGNYVLKIRIKSNNYTIREESRVITVVDSDTAGLPIATAAWIEPGAYTGKGYSRKSEVRQEDITDQLNQMKELGIKTLIFGYCEYVLSGTGTFYDSEIEDFKRFKSPVDYDMLKLTLERAEKNGQLVIIGTGRGFNLWTPVKEGLHANEHKGYEYAVDLNKRVINEICEKYGHYKSFYGIYLTHEPGNLKTDPPDNELTYFNDVTSDFKKKYPDKFILIAPTGTPIIDIKAIKESHVDIFAFQDAVGPGYIPGKYTYDPEKRIKQLDKVFSEYKNSMDNTDKHFWSDFETWEMKGPEYENAYPASFNRVIRQLETEKNYVSVQSMYAYPGFLDHPDSKIQLGGDRAVELYTKYKAHVKKFMSDNSIDIKEVFGRND